jgi:hypothetical protein
MERVSMRLTLPQAKKLMKGGTIQLSPSALKDNTHWLILETKTANKVRRAQRAGRGCRVCLNAREMEHSGEGIADFFKNAFNKVKQGARWVKSNVIDTDFYQKNLKPLVRQGVDTGFQAIAPRLGVAGPAVKAAVDKFGDYSSAYGLREELQKARDFYQKHAKKYVAPHLKNAVQSGRRALVEKAKKVAPKFAEDISRLDEEYGDKLVTQLGEKTGAYGLRRGRGIKSDYSNFLNHTHPAMRPVMLPAIGGGAALYSVPTGGSFKVAGAGRRRGLPMGGSFMGA